jgi:hypothetical protein
MLRVELEVPSGVTHNADGGVDRVGRTVVVGGRQRLRCALIGHPVLRDLPGTSSQRQHLLDGIGVHLHRPEPTDRSVRTDWVLRVRLAVGHAVAETVGPATLAADDADHPMTAVFRNLSDDQLAYLATLTNEQRVEYINGVRDLDDEYLAATNTEPQTP